MMFLSRSLIYVQTKCSKYDAGGKLQFALFRCYQQHIGGLVNGIAIVIAELLRVRVFWFAVDNGIFNVTCAYGAGNLRAD